MHPGAIPADRALQAAADQIAAKILAKADQLPARTRSANSTARTASSVSLPPADSTSGGAHAESASEPMTLLVGRIEGGKIYITGGQDDGLKVND